MSRLSSNHLLGLEGVPRADIELILDTADTFREVLERTIKKVPTLRGLTVLNLFYEPSTRTRISFELAEKRLSADTIAFTKAGTSVSKGESLRDTVQNIEAMKIDMVVVRHSSAGAPYFLTQCVDANIINAGDGSHEHPTQALLDMYTIRKKYGRLDGLRVVLVGDVRHSRVIRSNIWGLKTMGASVALCGPSTLLPREIEQFGCDSYTDLDEALDGADVVNVMRIQLERQQAGLFPSQREYTNLWGINRERLKRLNKNYTIMHPGPINRGVEITSDVADGDRSVILDQVTNGQAVRMAVLYLLRGKDEGEVE
ncbi:MAG TPA: aspartate carbamoyltransferase catalytic subunit [candidate division Zixibacteria bacterium]|nr:aspartate carbamoyltransferase catalytic subunit [candidate division Zixibacteria bacterium]MDD4917815.1 aspartate carbamoyltransferase catalytic subunit [candidate division Zixibacteria bacterium]MDM7974209.1 aspartate carbamoyltransferase catalytic subunit [candidate division Zixibacteria bacterium]HOD66070.1 aspartate carbamoyltransferase catalytic subunit [candidate division Zixibacteria bacterium]HOZ07813.1 aspartate carbamoyltransferase catalytic subunit [candidate division Zixibacteri